MPAESPGHEETLVEGCKTCTAFQDSNSTEKKSKATTGHLTSLTGQHLAARGKDKLDVAQ